MSTPPDRIPSRAPLTSEAAALAQGKPPGRPLAEQAAELWSPLSAMLPPALELFKARGEGRVKPWPFPPALASLGAVLGGGIWPGCYVLAGGTGTGKSQLCMELALHGARELGGAVGYVGLELSPAGISARVLGNVEGKPWPGAWFGRWTPDAGAVAELSRLPFYATFSTAYGFTPERLRLAALGLRHLHPQDDPLPPLLILDYLQLIGDDPEQRRELRQRIAAAAAVGRDVARELGVIVLLVSSVAREHYARLIFDGPPTEPPVAFVGIGKEAGEVEFSADGLIVLAKGKRGTGARDARIWLGLAKARAMDSEGIPAVESWPAVPFWWPLDFDGARFHPLTCSALTTLQREAGTLDGATRGGPGAHPRRPRRGGRS